MIEVLVVDDNTGDSEMTMNLFALHDPLVHPQSVADGMEAMLFLRYQGQNTAAITPDLIMLDLDMPRKSGWEVLDEVKSDDRLKQIPVVVFTGSEHPGHFARCYGRGANSVVSKPGDLAAYKAAISAIANYWLTTPEKKRPELRAPSSTGVKIWREPLLPLK